MCSTFGSTIVVDGVRLAIDDLPDSPDSAEMPMTSVFKAIPLHNLNRSKEVSDSEMRYRQETSQVRYEETYERMMARRAVELRAKASNCEQDEEPDDFSDCESSPRTTATTTRDKRRHYDAPEDLEHDYYSMEKRPRLSSDSSIATASLQHHQQQQEYESFYGGSASTSRDVLWADERVPTSDSDTSVKWIPVLDPWQRDFESLKQPGENHEPGLCFGCDWQESNGRNAVYVDKWNQLIHAFLDGLMNTGRISSLGRELYEIFSKTVVATMIDDCVCEVDREVWTPYGLMYHFLYHHPDPFIRIYVLTMRARTATETIMSNELYEEHPVSGRRVVVPTAQQKLDKAIDTELKLLKSNPVSMTFANKNRKLSDVGYPMLSSRVPVITQTAFAHAHQRWK